MVIFNATSDKSIILYSTLDVTSKILELLIQAFKDILFKG